MSSAQDAIEPCPQSGEGVHIWLMEAAWACRKLDMSEEHTCRELHSLMTRRPSPSNEVEMTVSKVFNTDPKKSHSPMLIKPSYRPDRLTALARRQDGFSTTDLTARSPIRPDTRTPASFLHAIFKSGESILCFSQFVSQGQALWTRPPELEPYNAGGLSDFLNQPEGNGAWFLSNPIDGQWITLDRLKSGTNPLGRTRRAEENLTAFRYLVVESDKADPLLWIAALVQIPLPIVAVYSSGGKSVHSLVRVDAESGDHWRELKAKLAPTLLTLGADEAAMTAGRLTRLPQCFRAEKDRWQELLYLNPTADETPICELPAQPPSPTGSITPAFDCDDISQTNL